MFGGERSGRQVNKLYRQLQMSKLPDPHQQLHNIQDYNFQTQTVSRYSKGGFLGKGGFARCYELISQQTQEIYAVKIIQKSSLIKQRSKMKLMSQIKIHQSLNHKNVVKFKHNFQDNDNVYILLELCTNKTLNDLIRRKRKLKESEVKYYMLQVLEGLEYLHANKVIHRDLKLGNLFLSQSMQLKIGDFGLASKLDVPGEKRKTICGTPNYIAPQILESKGHSYEVDVWSFGVIVYTLVYGRPPFESKDVKQTYKKIKSFSVSNQFKQLVISTLQHQPYKRPSLSQLKDFQFFRQVNLSRQPSISFKTSSYSACKDDRQLSDNGKLYTNNELLTSKDTTRQKSQDKFLATERTGSEKKNLKVNIKRTSSQRVLKEMNNTVHNGSQAHNSRLGYQRSQLTERGAHKSRGEDLAKSAKCEYVSVKKWIDYSSKYGIGYALSNDSFGVYFNDSTKIISTGNENFLYIEKLQKEDTRKEYSFSNHPFELKKKVSLFTHFKGYLCTEPENPKKKILRESSPRLNRCTSEPGTPVYVRRWFRSKHAVIFRLSNKSVQVIFIDQSELIINSISKQVIYINKHKQEKMFSLSEIMQSDNRELIKRFEYTKDVLNQMAASHEAQKKN